MEVWSSRSSLNLYPWMLQDLPPYRSDSGTSPAMRRVDPEMPRCKEFFRPPTSGARSSARTEPMPLKGNQRRPAQQDHSVQEKQINWSLSSNPSWHPQILTDFETKDWFSEFLGCPSFGKEKRLLPIYLVPAVLTTIFARLWPIKKFLRMRLLFKPTMELLLMTFWEVGLIGLMFWHIQWVSRKHHS